MKDAQQYFFIQLLLTIVNELIQSLFPSNLLSCM